MQSGNRFNHHTTDRIPFCAETTKHSISTSTDDMRRYASIDSNPHTWSQRSRTTRQRTRQRRHPRHQSRTQHARDDAFAFDSMTNRIVSHSRGSTLGIAFIAYKHPSYAVLASHRLSYPHILRAFQFKHFTTSYLYALSLVLSFRLFYSFREHSRTHCMSCLTSTSLRSTAHFSICICNVQIY